MEVWLILRTNTVCLDRYAQLQPIVHLITVSPHIIEETHPGSLDIF